MRKEVTESVRERIMVIDNRVKELKSANVAGDDGEVLKLKKEFWDIREEYDLFDKVFMENGKAGVVDIFGNVVVPALYKDFPELYNYTIYGRLPIPACDFNDKYALVASDGEGAPVCAFEYDMIKFKFGSSALFQCWKRAGDKYLVGVIDCGGNVVVPCEMDEVYGMSNNYAVVEKDGKLGAVTTGGLYIKPAYDEFEERDGLLAACVDGVWGYISSKGEFIDMDDEERMDGEVLLCLFEH